MGMKNAINNQVFVVNCKSFRAIVTSDWEYVPREYPKTKEYVHVTLIFGSEVYAGTAICMPEDVEKFTPIQLMQIGISMAVDRALDSYINARIVRALPMRSIQSVHLALGARATRKRQLKKEFWTEFNRLLKH